MLLNFFCFTAQAQQISGKIYDENNQPLPYANVLLLAAADSTLIKGTATDTTGAYVIEQIKAGDYLLSAQMVGYKNYYSEAFALNNTPQNFPDIRLREATTQLGEVTVRSTKPMIEVTPNALTVNVEASPVLQNGTAQDVLRKSPGITVDQNGNISLKGKANVLVYLDGKPTYLSDTDLARLLESTPAKNIEKIEIMDNPPARYDAEGNAGIINIVRTAQAATGLNGSINLNSGYGRYPKLNPSLNLNYRQKKFNVFGNYSHYYAKRFQHQNIFRRIPYQGDTTLFDQYSTSVNRVNNNNFRTGADWFITPKATLGVLLSGNVGRWRGNTDNLTELGGEYNNPYDGLTAESMERNTWQNLTYNVNFKQDFEKAGTLSIDVDNARWNNTSRQNNDNFYFSNEGSTAEPPLLVRTATETAIDIWAIKADYTRNIFGNWGLETGLKTSSVVTDNALDFNRLVDNRLVNDTLRSNRFQYDEKIYAGYAELSKKFNDQWQVKAGLRGEQTFSDGYSVTLDSAARRQYFNLFPSASLSYKMSEQHNLSLSYSRRIDRPDYGNLNPFEYFLDRFTFSRGNPFLRPQYTNAYGLTYGFKDAVFVTLNYNRTTDAITQVLLQDEAQQTTFQTTVNLNRINAYSVSLAAPLPVTQWWMLNLNATGYYNDIQSPFSEGGQINKSRFSYNLRAQNTFTLPGDVKLEVMGYYNSPQLWGLFEIGSQYQLDAGVSKTWGRFRAQASLDDVFRWQRAIVDIRQGDIDAQVRNRWESRVFRLSLSYRFGNEKIRQARQRGTASDDIQKRAGSGNN